MALALALGRRGLGRVWPNPAVGCVIARGTRVLGRGWTQPGGRPHAEVVALAASGDNARGATAYVTLEPCAHEGHTGPCAQALIHAGVARVVIAVGDPDPRVSGRGIAMLRDAGIEVTVGPGATEAKIDHAGFFSRITQGRPAVTLKLAASIDGRIATGSGDSRWITGAAARRQVHALRAAHDAVMVGSGTVLADDPDLRVRDLGVGWQPVRIVLDSRLRMAPDGRLARSAREAPVWALHGEKLRPGRAEALMSAGVRLLPTRASKAGLHMDSALALLGDEGLTRVLCEGGGQVAASLLLAGAVTRIVAFGAGVVIGAEGQPNFGALGLGPLAEAPRFDLDRLDRVGNDICAQWVPRAP
ncbi:MAG: bifunctional diaminohydroxyphosphoribosylaminopyrimidine deaminase/5-amino-6-(5-phosphoribosylamino)uracil reductase RibD [Pseudomonadota bacterium]